MVQYFLGIDVGTGSARCGVFSENGQLLRTEAKDIKINSPQPDFYEQSSQDIWMAVVQIIKAATQDLDKSMIKGIAFCATCSLVLPDTCLHPSQPWDIIMWMDHRAKEEAESINNSHHQVLNFLGGKVSLEMQTPKLLWLKNNRPDIYKNCQEFFDLPDFLRWKATGSTKRSICCVVCKWTHIHSPEGNHWDDSYFKEIGIPDVLPRIGSTFSHSGDSDELLPEVAKELGFPLGVKVGQSLIDAHSGALGMLGCRDKEEATSTMDITKRLGLICGTSNCHMALSKEPFVVPGVWGPFYGVVLPNLHLSEGGQSAAGKLLDHVVSSHPAYHKMRSNLSHSQVLSKLEGLLEEMEKSEKCVASLTKDVHIWPDFHGNRSPIADPSLKGMITGLTLSDSETDLAVLFLATIQALAYGSKHILETMVGNGHSFDRLVICGGLAKSKIFIQTHADVLGIDVLIPNCAEPVLLGAAISAASARKQIFEAVDQMSGEASSVQSNKSTAQFHEMKYAVFMEMLRDQLKYKKMMQ